MNNREFDAEMSIISKLIYNLSNHPQFLDYKKEIEEMRHLFYSSNRAACSKSVMSDLDKKDDILRLNSMVNDFVALVFELKEKPNKCAKKRVIEKIRNILTEVVDGEHQDGFNFLAQQDEISKGELKEEKNDKKLSKRMNDIFKAIGVSNELTQKIDDDTPEVTLNDELEEKDLLIKILERAKDLELIENDYYSILTLLGMGTLNNEDIRNSKEPVRARRFYLFLKNEIKGSLNEKEKVISIIIDKKLTLDLMVENRKTLKKERSKAV